MKNVEKPGLNSLDKYSANAIKEVDKCKHSCCSIGQPHVSARQAEIISFNLNVTFFQILYLC